MPVTINVCFGKYHKFSSSTIIWWHKWLICVLGDGFKSGSFNSDTLVITRMVPPIADNLRLQSTGLSLTMYSGILLGLAFFLLIRISTHKRWWSLLFAKAYVCLRHYGPLVCLTYLVMSHHYPLSTKQVSHINLRGILRGSSNGHWIH